MQFAIIHFQRIFSYVLTKISGFLSYEANYDTLKRVFLGNRFEEEILSLITLNFVFQLDSKIISLTAVAPQGMKVILLTHSSVLMPVSSIFRMKC